MSVNNFGVKIGEAAGHATLLLAGTHLVWMAFRCGNAPQGKPHLTTVMISSTAIRSTRVVGEIKNRTMFGAIRAVWKRRSR